MLATIIIMGIIVLWLGYVAYRVFFDKKNPIGACGNECNTCHDPLCHLDIVEEYKKDKERELKKSL